MKQLQLSDTHMKRIPITVSYNGFVVMKDLFEELEHFIFVPGLKHLKIITISTQVRSEWFSLHF